MAKKNSDAYVAVVDTSVLLKGGQVEINGELFSSTSSRNMLPGDVVRASDLDPKFVAGLEEDDSVLRPVTAAEAKEREAARAEAEKVEESEEVQEEVEEVPYVAPVDDGTAGDSGRDLKAEAEARLADAPDVTARQEALADVAEAEAQEKPKGDSKAKDK